MDESERNYVTAWRTILHELAGWNNDQINSWLDSNPVDFSNPFMFHESASWYVSRFILPTDVCQDRPSLIRLRSELEMLIENRMHEGGSDTDWLALRKEIADLIARLKG